MTTNKAPEVNLRNIVLNMLLENNKGRLSHFIVKDTLDENKNLDKNQRAFITRLFQGTIERTIEEDYIINFCFRKQVNYIIFFNCSFYSSLKQACNKSSLIFIKIFIFI